MLFGLSVHAWTLPRTVYVTTMRAWPAFIFRRAKQKLEVRRWNNPGQWMCLVVGNSHRLKQVLAVFVTPKNFFYHFFFIARSSRHSCIMYATTQMMHYNPTYFDISFTGSNDFCHLWFRFSIEASDNRAEPRAYLIY